MKELKLLAIIIVLNIVFLPSYIYAQNSTISGNIISITDNKPVEYANVFLKNTNYSALTNKNGEFTIKDIEAGNYTIIITAMGFVSYQTEIKLEEVENKTFNYTLKQDKNQLDEVVISGTMKEVSKLESPVPVEVYTADFFKANPTPSVFESLQNVNGVRPQLNCNVCNTGDIHINGLEGPYTMILIDGMPIVSGLSTVYGLTGIPQSLIERVEIVKGPASTLYGSEAVGGVINIITKKPSNAPTFSGDVFSTSWGEINTDLGYKFKVGKNTQSLLGVNYFNYQNPIDNNNDGFTDITLQNRLSVFNKWSFDRKDNKVSTIAGRYIYEDRWGGEMNWDESFRGGDSIYGESIYTSRWELFGAFQLPVREDITFQYSANGHDQNSVYGDVVYIAQQYVGFGQLVWNKTIGKHNDFLLGATYRYTYYDDNTPATAEVNNTSKTKPSIINLPGVFIQDEITVNEQNKLLLGLRYDYNSEHGNVLTPRLNYKLSSKNKRNILRLSTGSGYRVANVFTEDHAALTGARTVEFANELNPETSWNANVNFVKKIYTKKGNFIGIDATAFYTYFTNRILPDYETDVNKIIYDNLDGFSVSKGFSVNLDIVLNNGLKILAGGTFQDVSFTENDIKQNQLLTERLSGVWSAEYLIKKWGVTVNYTGNVYGPMYLPLLGDLDNRPGKSPTWSVQNIQLTKTFNKSFEVYGGVKNLLNYTPPANSIARSFDPFDRNVQFDNNGQVVATPNNPNALSFDPTYVFAPNQGIRGFLGFRYIFN
jgi:outer membrane receptor for ferrienterochelin and colicins